MVKIISDEDLFIDMIVESIKEIDEQYFSTIYQIAGFGECRIPSGWLVEDDYVYRPGERMFAYEFYHQLRNNIDKKRTQKDFFQGAYLQGEIKKTQIDKLLNHLRLEALSANFIPDILFHSPGNSSLHICVIEIKANNNLTIEQLYNDLFKLIEFVARYHYNLGVFICICKRLDNLKQLLNSNENLHAELIKSLKEIKQQSLLIVAKGHHSDVEKCFIEELL